MKIARQTKIIELINHNIIETQEELVNRLIADGFEVTQATVSRDIRDLKLTKIATDLGKQKYVILPTKKVYLSEKYIGIFKNGFSHIDIAGNMIVIKTLTGMAMAVAAAVDAIDFDEIVGCIAGDDTIFCAVRSEEDAIHLMESLNKIAYS